MANNITLNLGKGITVTVDKDRMFKYPAIRVQSENIGLKNILQDCHAPFTKKDHPTTYKDLSEKAVARKMAAMYNGELRVNTPTMSLEEVKAQALDEMTIEELDALLKAKKAKTKAA